MADGHAHLMEALLDEIGSGCTGQALLDLGCGTGKFLTLAKHAGFGPRAGIDASPNMVETTRQHNPDAEIKVGSFEALPWPDQHFDQVTSIEALYYCPEPGLALSEGHRVLKPGGRFDMIIDYYAESEGTASWAEGLGFDITRLAVADWIALTQTAGFAPCQSRRIIHPEAKTKSQSWTASVWYPTKDSYDNYLDNGALWLTARRSPQS